MGRTSGPEPLWEPGPEPTWERGRVLKLIRMRLRQGAARQLLLWLWLWSWLWLRQEHRQNLPRHRQGWPFLLPHAPDARHLAQRRPREKR